MLEEVRSVLYVDSQGREAYASELLGATACGDFTMFQYRKHLKVGSKGDDGVAYMCLPEHCTMHKGVSPSDTEEGAKCELMTALSIEIGMIEHQLEYLKQCKNKLSEELR